MLTTILVLFISIKINFLLFQDQFSQCNGYANSNSTQPQASDLIYRSGYIVCTVCGKSLKGKQGFKRHMQGAHKLGTSYKCACNSIFTWEWSFKQHKKKCKAQQLTDTNAIEEHSQIG